MQESPTELDVVKQWYRYNSFVRKKYLEAIFEKIPQEERYKDKGASFPSIVDIFVHVIDAYRGWFIFAYEDRRAERDRLRGKKNYTKEEVENEERKIDALVNSFLERLSQEDLGGSFVFRDGTQFQQVKVRDMLWHLVEEELQHRGELNALFWQLNIDPPVIGWNPFEEEKEMISEEEYLRIKTKTRG